MSGSIVHCFLYSISFHFLIFSAFCPIALIILSSGTVSLLPFIVDAVDPKWLIVFTLQTHSRGGEFFYQLLVKGRSQAQALVSWWVKGEWRCPQETASWLRIMALPVWQIELFVLFSCDSLEKSSKGLTNVICWPSQAVMGWTWGNEQKKERTE